MQETICQRFNYLQYKKTIWLHIRFYWPHHKQTKKEMRIVLRIQTIWKVVLPPISSSEESPLPTPGGTVKKCRRIEDFVQISENPLLSVVDRYEAVYRPLCPRHRPKRNGKRLPLHRHIHRRNKKKLLVSRPRRRRMVLPENLQKDQRSGRVKQQRLLTRLKQSRKH